MSKSGKEIVAEAAKRLADEELDYSIVQTVDMICTEFAPIAELIEATRRWLEADHRGTCDDCEGLRVALAEVEKMGRG